MVLVYGSAAKMKGITHEYAWPDKHPDVNLGVIEGRIVNLSKGLAVLMY